MILFYLLVVTAPMPNHPLFGEPLGPFTVVKWLGIACCVYALFSAMRRRRLPSFLGSLEMRAFLVLVCIAWVSSVTLGRKGDISFSPMSSYFSFLLLCFATITLVNSVERLHKTLLAAIAGVAWASLYVIREFLATGGNGRPGYVAGDSNYFAASAVLVVPVAVYFVKAKSSPWERRFCIASLVVIFIAFTLASSRGGLLGLGVVILYMAVRSGKSRRTAIVTALVLIPMFLLSPASPLSRMLHPDYGDKLGAEIRWGFWKEGLEMIENHPVTGVGVGNFTAYSSFESFGAKDKQGMACNTLLEITAELGIPGLLAYCAILVGSLKSAGRLRTEGKKRKEIPLFYAGEGMLAGLLGFLAAAMFVSTEYMKPFWVFVALTATVPTLLLQQARQMNNDRKKAVAMTTRSYATTKA